MCHWIDVLHDPSCQQKWNKQSTSDILKINYLPFSGNVFKREHWDICENVTRGKTWYVAICATFNIDTEFLCCKVFLSIIVQYPVLRGAAQRLYSTVSCFLSCRCGCDCEGLVCRSSLHCVESAVLLQVLLYDIVNLSLGWPSDSWE